MRKARWLVADGLYMRVGGKLWKWYEKNKDRLHGWVKKVKPKPKPKPTRIVMYDDVAVGLIPLLARAIAGYVDGIYGTWAYIVAHFPKAKKVSIATSASHLADILDVEKGDARIDQVPAWLNRAHSLWKPRKDGPSKPGVYTSESNLEALVSTLQGAGIPRSSYLLWSAHYGAGEHICGPDTCGSKVKADATQFTDKAQGKSLDESLCEPWFFG